MLHRFIEHGKALVITLSLVSGGFASILCPTAFNPNQTIHLPHPTSCSKFLTCVGSHPVEQDCPAGLHWNGEQSRCDYPGTTQCSRFGDSEVPKSFNAAAVASSVCLPQTDQCPLNSKPTEHVIFLKHRDCRKFYACVSTHQVEMSCPPKLYWNSRSCVCDYETEDQCDERIEEDVPQEADQEEHPIEEEDVPADEEAHPIAEEVAPEEAEQEEHPIEEEADQGQLEPARKRRAADSSSSSSNDTSTSNGSGSSGSGSSGSGSSGSGSSGSGSSGSGDPVQSGADIRSVSSIVMVVATVIMSAF